MGGGEHTGLQCGELRGPLGVGRVEGLVHDAGAPGGVGGEARVTGITSDHLGVVGNWCVPGSIHEPDALASAPQRLVRRETDRPGPEDHVPGRGHAVASIRGRSEGASAAVRVGSRTWSRRPDSAENVIAP